MHKLLQINNIVLTMYIDGRILTYQINIIIHSLNRNYT